MPKVMIVEDSNLMQAVISNFLKKDAPSAAVITARDGQEGVDKYKAERPDLVFMDIKMPRKDGLTALEEIRAYDPGAKVVMCTALKEPEQEARARKAGARGYLTKPFSREDIKRAVTENLNL